MSDRFADILDVNAISLDIRAKKKPEIIRELAALLVASGVASDVDAITRKVLAREDLATTGVGNGIAIPHCLSTCVSGTALAFGRRVPGARFDAVDRQPVQLFFLMVGLPGSHNTHLRLLSKLSRFLYDPDTKAGLLAARTAEEVIAIFAERERAS